MKCFVVSQDYSVKTFTQEYTWSNIYLWLTFHLFCHNISNTLIKDLKYSCLTTTLSYSHFHNCFSWYLLVYLKLIILQISLTHSTLKSLWIFIVLIHKATHNHITFWSNKFNSLIGICKLVDYESSSICLYLPKKRFLFMTSPTVQKLICYQKLYLVHFITKQLLWRRFVALRFSFNVKLLELSFCLQLSFEIKL